jgi:hypothetical protein
MDQSQHLSLPDEVKAMREISTGSVNKDSQLIHKKRSLWRYLIHVCMIRTSASPCVVNSTIFKGSILLYAITLYIPYCTLHFKIFTY